MGHDNLIIPSPLQISGENTTPLSTCTSVSTLILNSQLKESQLPSCKYNHQGAYPKLGAFPPSQTSLTRHLNHYHLLRHGSVNWILLAQSHHYVYNGIIDSFGMFIGNLGVTMLVMIVQWSSQDILVSLLASELSQLSLIVRFVCFLGPILYVLKPYSLSKTLLNCLLFTDGLDSNGTCTSSIWLPHVCHEFQWSWSTAAIHRGG